MGSLLPQVASSYQLQLLPIILLITIYATANSLSSGSAQHVPASFRMPLTRRTIASPHVGRHLRAEPSARYNTGSNLQAFNDRRSLKSKQEKHAPTFLAPLDYKDFQFLITLDMGTPPQPVTLQFDVASDLLWMQCKPCTHCFPQSDPPFDPKQSSTFDELPCVGNKFCAFLSSTNFSSCSASGDVCKYDYQYASALFSRGTMATDTLTLTQPSGDKTTVDGIVFSCGNDDSQNIEYNGVLGFGQSLLSLGSQLGKVIDHEFSYCLVPEDSPTSASSSLLLGLSSAVTRSNILTTPMLSNSHTGYLSYFYIGLHRISIDGKHVKIPDGAFDIGDDGTGGVILDTSIVISLFPDVVYKAIASAFEHQVTQLDKAPQQGFLTLCYNKPNATDFKLSDFIPSMTLHFENGDLNIAPENSFIQLADEHLCLCMASAGKNIPVSIISSLLQQNLQVGFDLKAKTISFKPTDCTTL